LVRGSGWFPAAPFQGINHVVRMGTEFVPPAIEALGPRGYLVTASSIPMQHLRALAKSPPELTSCIRANALELLRFVGARYRLECSWLAN
jgi:hypothetical protein